MLRYRPGVKDKRAVNHMAQTPTKCELKQYTFQRNVLLHSLDGPLLSDQEALKAHGRPDEVLVHVQGGSHTHMVEVPDPVEDAPDFAAAVAAADAKLAADEASAQKLIEKVPEIQKLIAVGRSTAQIAELLKTSSYVVQRAIELAAAVPVTVTKGTPEQPSVP